MYKVVSNSSPLIGLSSINCLEILHLLWEEILIPNAVYQEVVINGQNRAGVREVQKACNNWIKVVKAKNTNEITALEAILDKGESEAIVLAQECQADFILLDNREPRLFAKKINSKPIGTLGLLLLAFRKGFLKDPVEKVNMLRSKGFWLSDNLIEHFKKEVSK